MSVRWHGKLRSRDRTRRLRIVVRYLLLRGSLSWGDQSEIAGQFGVSRQRVNQIVVQERRRMMPEALSAKGEF